MEKITLYKFFAGEASENDKARIKAWLEEDDAHRQQLLDERAYFDAVLLADDAVLENDRRHSLSYRLIHAGWRVGRWAAVLVLAFVGSYWLLEHQYRTVDKALNVVSVPPGQRTELLLADGTKVYLNAGSTLSYPSRFTGDTRSVSLSGEAYFKVAKDAEHRFIVHTPDQSAVEVYGTHFNIEAYPGDPYVTTTLTEGKVGFLYKEDATTKRAILEPGQKLIYNTSNQNLSRHRTTGISELSWTEGKIIFENTPLPEALHMLSKRFNVNFIVKDTRLNKNRFTGTFTTQRLEKILKYFEISSRIRWRYLNDPDIHQEKIRIEIY